MDLSAVIRYELQIYPFYHLYGSLKVDLSALIRYELYLKWIMPKRDLTPTEAKAIGMKPDGKDFKIYPFTRRNSAIEKTF